MNLPYGTTNAWTVATNHHKKVLGHESKFIVGFHDLDMCKPLSVRAHFILALNDKDASLTKYPPCFDPRFVVQCQDRIMILPIRAVSRTIVSVVTLKCGMRLSRMSRPARRMHVGGIQHDAIDFPVAVRQGPAIDAIPNVRCQEVVATVWKASRRPPKSMRLTAARPSTSRSG